MRLTTAAFASTLVASSAVYGQLDAKMKAKGEFDGKIYFGIFTDLASLSNSQTASIVRTEFGEITPATSALWGTIQPSGYFNYGGFDTMVNFAQSNGKIILVWHSQLPSWVSSIGDASTLTSVIQNHIATIGSRYRGKIYAWDVVNEIFNEDGSLRSSIFSRLLGDRFVDVAFKAARAADSNAKLYINDYNLDSVNTKVNSLVNFVNQKKAAGVPIDGVGTETHLSAGGAGGVQAALQKLASTGCDVAITQLDIAGAASNNAFLGFFEGADCKNLHLGNDYTTVVKACLNTPKCVGITISGICDDSWRSTSSLLFDSNCQRKTAYNAIISTLS
ncbi:endo-beta-1,4-xylanase [Ceratobasidium sp. AG-Ba]|nr:endo-beta-1,4-xylanase [Ceratobasidium sp. AG-Ba]QRV91789.1 endo-beta-1,4-xylanase [Ceratobasidium sp. AG-Ba]